MSLNNSNTLTMEHNYYNTTTSCITAEYSDLPPCITGVKCDTSYPNCELQRQLWVYTIPIVLLLGTVGNILIILVMAKKPLRNTAFGLYLIVMAAMDLLYIWVGLSRHFIKNFEDFDIRSYDTILCVAQKFLLYGSCDSSVWLLVAVTLERTLSVYTPIRAIKLHTLTRTRIAITVIVLVQFLWGTNMFFVYGEQVSKDGTCMHQCWVKEQYDKDIYIGISNAAATLNYSLLPFLSMLTMNIAIFARLRKRDQRYKRCATMHNGTSNIKCKTKTSSVSHKTLMLLPVTMFFLITTMPHLILTGYEYLYEDTETDARRATTELVDYFVSILGYLNHSLNFFLYCMTGKMFRSRCAKLFTSCSKKSENDSWGDTYYSRSPAFKHKSVNIGAYSPSVSPPSTPSNRIRTQSLSVDVKLNKLELPKPVKD